MIDEPHDEFIADVSAVLRPLPAVDAEAKARVLLAVAAERERDRSGHVVPERAPARRMRWWVASGALTAAAAALLFFRPFAADTPARSTGPVAAAAPASVATATLAAHDARAMDATALPVQLVFRAPEADRVAIVGDFNGWSKDQDFMTRDAASGLWSATLRVRPGRHVYAFVVNDTQWVRDPRAPVVPDADFGRPGSVMLVGKP